MQITVTPYKNNSSSKKEQIAAMFNNIAYRYDFLNNLLSIGIHVIWRKKAIQLLKKSAPKNILDIATGTASFAIEAMKLNPDKITGVDISERMLNVGEKKIKNRKLDHKIKLMLADSENLPFPEDSFDAITVGFGVRNFENLLQGLKNMHRVLKPGGTVVILEFSKPKKFPIKQLYHFYFSKLCPLVGNFFSKDKIAYSYLPESVKAFPDGQQFIQIMNNIGYKQTTYRPLTFGIASIYTGKK